MAECSRGDVIAHPASGFFEPVKFNLTKPFQLLIPVEKSRLLRRLERTPPASGGYGRRGAG
jgi:hypothetical protein